MTSLEKLKYPIGKPAFPKTITTNHLSNWIEILENFPVNLENLTQNLTLEQLNTPYRKGGWSIKQVIHHCADSHHNSYTRFKWALTENKPTIKAYFEERWATLIDYNAPIAMSILHLKAVHAKLVYLLKNLSETDLNKSFIHPENNEEVPLKINIGIYAWHCNHHFTHIKNLIKRKKWE